MSASLVRALLFDPLFALASNTTTYVAFAQNGDTVADNPELILRIAAAANDASLWRLFDAVPAGAQK